MPKITDNTEQPRINIDIEVDDEVTAIAAGDVFIVVTNTNGTLKLTFEHPRLLYDFIGVLQKLHSYVMKKEAKA